MVIKSFLMNKLLMRSFLNDLTFINNQDSICMFDCSQPMCDDDNRFSNGQFTDSLLDQMFIFRVNACCCLVQNYDIGVF